MFLNQKFHPFSTIRRRVLFFSLGTVLTLGLVSYYNQWNAQWALSKVFLVYEQHKSLLDIWNRVEETGSCVETYLTSKGSDTLLQFIRLSGALERQLNQELETVSISPASRSLRRNVYGLGMEYLRESQTTVNAKRGRDEEGYSKSYEKTQKVAAFLKSELDKLSLEEYKVSLQQLSSVYQKMQWLQLSNSLMLGGLISMALLLSVWFSRKLTQPLDALAQAATEIARGNYDTALPRLETEEIGRLTEAFDRMRAAIVVNFEQMRKKAEIETENLRMKTLLKNAEFQALQAQINPHFLFNTLNAASQLAMMEEAERTEMFLDQLAKLMRHNIRRLDQPVSLAEELSSLESYIYIQKIRFGNRIKFDLQQEPADTSILMPPMILQPLVENSIIHGLKDREKGGTIGLRVFSDRPGYTELEVWDNGDGFSIEILQRFMDDVEGHTDGSARKDISGQSTGIGLGNVIHRLQIFFNYSKVISIKSLPGQGTQIHLSLPHSLIPGGNS